jgi:hypothetical protein
VVELANTKGLKPFVRKDLQVRILPPLPTPLMQLPPDPWPDQLPSYSYLLGMYLGDGYIGRTPRTYRFHVSLIGVKSTSAGASPRQFPSCAPDGQSGFGTW